ncbi:gliding motility-associated protein GldE [Putridiphycobacter roseus]|uniref:Gliding motility-associated protein GldE n=1 Tax=Putridiphycobacter roseus TaxID=2219161 RepID=A0A2W1N0Q3_9FLAO|nr:gliding motility-associated protein GldE [Putridiphycobacter roseus]PZE16541.1 gliding motility-associated protein GldE [Putridiphycobacter roseus]
MGTDLIPLIVSFVILILLLVGSALISGSEVAFFSLKPVDLEELEKDTSKKAKLTITLLERPKRLLATILIANNFINVSIIVLSSFISTLLFPENSIEDWLKLFIDIVVITFIILLFGEVIPKVYASKNSKSMTLLMGAPLYKIGKFFPINYLVKGLVAGTAVLSNLGKKKSMTVSSDDLEQAIELTKELEGKEDEHKILEGIVKFGQTDVKQIMKARTDVVAFGIHEPYEKIHEHILEHNYSRIPVFEESFDNIKGILYIKDLIPFIDHPPENWHSLLREPYYVPENKKIDDLLKSFQERKIHMAIVVDEYGGTSGIITLEDILEEIVGDISEEYDGEDLNYTQIDEHTYLFEGKMSLMDFYKVIDMDGSLFEESKGESDTLAGFMIEQAGKILVKNEKIVFGNYTLIVEAADKRKLKKIKVIIDDEVA